MCVFSIVMPAYNAGNFIEEAIQSVVSQTYKNWELIVVDDGSTDNTSIIIKNFQQIDSRIIYLFQENNKQAAARNYGIKQSKGDWIAFLDADDIWLPQKLEIQIKYIKKIKADVFYTSGYEFETITKKQKLYNTSYGLKSGLMLYPILFETNMIPVLSAIININWIKKMGVQDERMQFVGCEDWDYFLRLALNNALFYGINEPLFLYRLNPTGISKNSIQMRLAQAATKIKNYDSDLLEKTFTYKMFKPIVNPLVNTLVSMKRFDDAIFILQALDLKMENQFYKINLFLIKKIKAASIIPMRLVNKIENVIS